MWIYIDESGSFVTDKRRRNRWSVVGAYVIPETGVPALSGIASRLRAKVGVRELKFRELAEAEYIDFLSKMADLPGIVIARAVNMTASSFDVIARHREQQAKNYQSNVPRMRHSSMKRALADLAKKIRTANDQRYVQLVLQLQLLHSCIRDGISYHVQRTPETLQCFRWRLDNKDESFNCQIDTMAAAHVQSCSLHGDALPILEGEDYSALERFRFSRGSGPRYLNETYELGVDLTRALDLRRILAEDFRFVDSRADDGVQIADLLVGGIRRALQQEFKKNLRAGRLLGKIMIQQPYNQIPVALEAFSHADQPLTSAVAQTVHAMRLNVRPFNSNYSDTWKLNPRSRS